MVLQRLTTPVTSERERQNIFIAIFNKSTVRILRAGSLTPSLYDSFSICRFSRLWPTGPSLKGTPQYETP